MVLERLRNKLNNLKGESDDQHDDYIVALDIGTENVKALLARVNGDDIEILGVGRAHQELSDMHSGAIADIAGVVQHCEDALTQAEDEAGLQAKHAVIGIAGELVKGTTSSAEIGRASCRERV